MNKKTRDLFDRRSLGEIVSVVMERLGHQAPIASVVVGVRSVATKDEYEVYAERGLAPQIRRELTRMNEKGLPEYLSVNGQYTAIRLFDPADYEDKARDYAKRGKENVAKIYVLAETCEEVHGVSFDPAAICAEYGLKAA